MRGEAIPHPRRIGRHVARILDLLTSNGASDVQVYKTKHLRICFKVGPHDLEMSASCTPRDEVDSANYFEQRLKRKIEGLLVQQNAGDA